MVMVSEEWERTRKMADAKKVRENLDVTKDSRVGDLFQEEC